MDSQDSPKQKYCPRCGNLKPLEEFPIAPNYPAGNFRKDTCTDCKRSRFMAKTEEKVVREMATSVRESVRRQARMDAPHIAELWEAVICDIQDRIGVPGETGVQALAGVIVTVLIQILADQGASKKDMLAKQRMLNMLIQLGKASTALQGTATESEMVTAEEVRAEVARTVKTVLTRDEVAELARQHGLKIVSEDDDDQSLSGEAVA